METARKMVGLFHGITGETTCLHWPQSTTFLAAFTLENQFAMIEIHIKAIYGLDLFPGTDLTFNSIYLPTFIAQS